MSNVVFRKYFFPIRFSPLLFVVWFRTLTYYSTGGFLSRAIVTRYKKNCLTNFLARQFLKTTVTY